MLRSGVLSCLHLLLGGIVPALLLCATPTRATAADVPPACTPTVARIVSMQGVVELRRAGQRDWAAVTRLDTPVCQGDVVHAGPRSRAALVILPEKFVRLDQNSTVSISVEGEETIVEFFQDETTPRDACGAGYFITRFPRKFKVRTPFVNAAVEGTEFLVSMSCSATSVAVFEGKVSAETLLANAQRFILNSGEAISAGPGEPPVIKVLIKPVDAVQWALYYPPLSEPGPGVGPDQRCDQSSAEARSRCLMVRAQQRLRVGRVDDAQADIDASLKLVPDNSNADAILSVISVAKNDKQRAMALAQQATQLDPVNPRAWIALSYAQQASFNLEEALSSAQRAAELEPRSSIPLTRVAELMMSLGKIRSAERAAQAAVDSNPDDSRAHSILGFVHLAEIDIKKAKADFEAAIALDSSDPMPRLGLGLAIIRSGKLTAGREQIEIAVALDPTNSLLRSYVGKAYYEEDTRERDKLAAAQYGLAKALDPNDPTPWFYDAILKYTQNKPVEALENLQKSIELNDNRAVYRSRLFLDEDYATRSADLGYVYTDLGFPQLALTEAAKSLASDPGSAAAHRFLYEADAQVPRREVARDAEELQAKLRSQISNVPFPIQPREAGLLTLDGTTGFAVGQNEYSPLFAQDGLRLQLQGLVGSFETAGGQALLTGMSDKLSFMLGAYGFETQGVRQNNDDRKSVYDGLVQLQLTPYTQIQVEATSLKRNAGDLTQKFFSDEFPDLVVSPLTFQIELDAVRLGAWQKFSERTDMLISLAHKDRTDSIGLSGSAPFLEINGESNNFQAQLLYRSENLSWLNGIGWYEENADENFVGFFETKSNPTNFNLYSYAFLSTRDSKLRLQAGLAYNALRSRELTTEQLSPKLGLIWTPSINTTISFALLQVLTPRSGATPSLEPSQIAGFNQFYSDQANALVRLAGVALEQRISPNLRAGANIIQRDVQVHLTNADFTVETHDWSELETSAYLYWVVSRQVAVSTAVKFGSYERPAEFTGIDGFTSLESLEVPASIRFFGPNGLATAITLRYVGQRGSFTDPFGATGFEQVDGSDHAWLLDLSFVLQPPGRRFFFALDAKNVTDQRFHYQDLATQDALLADRQNTSVFTRRGIFARFGVTF